MPNFFKKIKYKKKICKCPFASTKAAPCTSFPEMAYTMLLSKACFYTSCSCTAYLMRQKYTKIAFTVLMEKGVIKGYCYKHRSFKKEIALN